MLTLQNYYDRTDPAKGYQRHMFRAGAGLQSAELNEIQITAEQKLKSVGDALFKDGDIVSDCACVVDAATGSVTLRGGTVYINGMVRTVAAASFTIPVDSAVSIGVRLVELVVTEVEDPTLRDPAVGTRNYQEPGAARLQVLASWGWNGDGQAGDFYAVYSVVAGLLQQKDAPPEIDSVRTAIASYDRDSAGGYYIVSGLGVAAQLDRTDGTLTTLVADGGARVNGYGVTVARSLRKVEPIDRDLQAVIAEPRTFTPDAKGTMRITTDHAPIVSIDQVRITAQKSVTLTHGAFAGASDPLPDNAILSLVSVSDQSKTYAQGTDYKLTSGQVDWSPSGAEPAPGATYTVVYQYQSTGATVTDVDDTGFTVSGAVAGTLLTTDYKFALPRMDAVVIDQSGAISRIKGVASAYSVAPPAAPTGTLKLATLQHNWITDPTVTQDGAVSMPMDQIQAMKSMILNLYDLQAQADLKNDIGLNEPAAKRGVFVDPMTNDNLRDTGLTQDAVISNGELVLPNTITIAPLTGGPTAPVMADYTLEVVVEQTNRTGSVQVNPYQSFAAIPAVVTLAPAVDYATEVQNVLTGTRSVRVYESTFFKTYTTTQDLITATSTTEAQYIRQQDIRFSVKGFDAGEALKSVTFDGIEVDVK